MNRLGAAAAAIIACAISLGGGHALAQDNALDTQRFKPAATTGGFLQTEGTHVRHPVDPFSLGLWLSYAHNPLIVTDADGDVIERIVGSQLAFDLTASYAFTHWFELGMHAPLAYLDGDDTSEVALGDLRLLPKFRFLDDDLDGIGLGLITELRLPTHTSELYGGARYPAFAPRLLLDHRFGFSGFRLGLDVGVLIQKPTELREVHAGSEFQAGLGLGYRFDHGRSPVELLVDLRSAVGLSETDVEEVGLETMVGAGIDLSPAWKINVGAGLGMLEGYGVPTARALVGLRYQPSPNDPDHDGLASKRSAHPPPEDEAEPEAAAENLDAVDDAERERAVREGYDACPDLPEDFDGVEDEDGCPEGDRDGDGVLDYLDRCPDEAETINGFEDDDGCADEGPAKIVIEEGRLVILETIRFEPNSSRIDRDSHPIMNQIALTLRKYKEIDAIEIGGHTDSTGPRAFNMRLSRDRARAVRSYLLERGIKPARLRANGYGPDRPIADNGTEEGRAQNRRVEFLFTR
jgi:OmpA-OmpF porin, OOP family